MRGFESLVNKFKQEVKMDFEIYNGLDGKFKLKYNPKCKSVTVTFKDMEKFEAFFFWLEEMQRQVKE
jgi:hypothetical protein